MTLSLKYAALVAVNRQVTTETQGLIPKQEEQKLDLFGVNTGDKYTCHGAQIPECRVIVIIIVL